MAINYIYGLVDPNTTLIRYVGKTNNPDYRLRKHIEQAKRGKTNTYRDKWIKSLLNKNLLPSLTIIDECEESEINKMEIGYIKLLKGCGARLTNHTIGGDGGAMPLEIRKRWSEIRKGRPSPMKGRFHSYESKERNRISHIGKMVGIDSPVSRAVFQMKNNEVINEFVSITEASKTTSINRRGICNVLSKVAKTAGGFNWKYK